MKRESVGSLAARCFFVSLAILALMQSVAIAQSKGLKPNYLDPAERLIRLKVDTNDIAYLKSMVDNKEWYQWYLCGQAFLFLAERGHSEIVPLIKAKYDSAMLILSPVSKYYLDYNMTDYLTALYLLHDPDVGQMCEAFIDTVLTRLDIRHEGWHRYAIYSTLRILACAGDYTHYDCLKMLLDLDSRDTVSRTDFELVTAYAEKPEYRQTLFSFLKQIAVHSSSYSRVKAKHFLSLYFRDIPAAHAAIRLMAVSDPDPFNKEEAIASLWKYFNDSAAIDMFHEIIMNSNDSARVSMAVRYLSMFESPYAYAALLSCCEQRKQDSLWRIVKEAADDYAPFWFPEFHIWGIEARVDSLMPFTVQCRDLNWIGGDSLIGELTNHLSKARMWLRRKDSLNCLREVEKYWSDIENEYREHRSSGSRFVTRPGYYYLCSEAWFIGWLLRIPLPPEGPLMRQLDSLKSELKRQEDLKYVGGLLLAKNLELFVNQAERQLQRGDSAGAALNLRVFQLLVDETNEFTGELRTRKRPTVYINGQAYKQLFYRAKYILEDLPQSRGAIDLPGKLDKELRREMERMKVIPEENGGRN